MFKSGSLIYHPKHGFGTITGLQRHDPRHPAQDVAISAGMPDPRQDYYDIKLMDGGTLLVPVSRAEGAGLRPLTNGMDIVTACLNSQPRELPADFRKRAAELGARGQATDPTALVCSVRDMVAQSRGRTLSVSEKAWLDKSCVRISTEAALVDQIPRSEALAAIWIVVNELSAS